MKINRIQINNIGAINNADIPIEKHLNIFFGDVKQGKTTILNSVRWACGGSYPNDILSHGSEDGFIHIFFDNNSSVRREFYVSKTSGTKDRPVQYIKDNVIQSRPVEKLKELLNPFQLNQNYFTSMTALEKIRYAIDLFGGSTKEDTEALESIKKVGSDLRKKITEIKYMEAEKVDPVDPTELTKRLEEANAHNRIQLNVSEVLSKLEVTLDNLDEEKTRLMARLSEINEQEGEITSDIEQYAEVQPVIDTTELQQKISDAKLINYKAEQYEKAKQFNFNQDEEKAFIEEQIKAKTLEYKEKSAAVKAKLKTLNGSHGVRGLVFIEGDTFMYENTSADMLSTSQNAKLSSALQAKYPDSIGIELIDQGESWGTSIYDLIDKAIAEDKVILTTVVGERPAKSSKDVGVFVVTKGEVKGE